MKHLRLFNESVGKNYREVRYDYYFDKIDSSILDKMSQSEIDSVNKIVLPSRTNRNPYLTTGSRYCYLIPGDLVIYKDKDEWFFVNIMIGDTISRMIGEEKPPLTNLGKENNFYECDQFEGLLQLLRDKYRN